MHLHGPQTSARTGLSVGTMSMPIRTLAVQIWAFGRARMRQLRLILAGRGVRSVRELSGGGGAEDWPADFGAPGGAVVGVPRPGEVGLAYRPGNGQGVLGDVGAELAVGHVDVVVRAVMHGDREFRSRHSEGLDTSAGRRVGDRDVDGSVAAFDGEQLVVVQAAARPGRWSVRSPDWPDEIVHGLSLPREDIAADVGGADPGCRHRFRR